MNVENIFKNKFFISKNFLWLFLLSILYSCGKYPHRDLHALQDGTIVITDYNGDITTGKFDGEVRTFYPTGDMDHYYLTNGKIDGIYWYYYKNGRLKGIQYFANGKRQGEGKFLYENGQLRTSEYYRNDSLNGFKRVYFKNGKLDSEVLHINCIPQYVLTFDSAGYSNSSVVFPELKFPHELHLGEKFRLEFTYPQTLGGIYRSQCNIGIITENFENIDSMKDCSLEARVINKKWEYVLRKNKREINNFPYTVYNIPIRDTNYSVNHNVGYGVYEFTPSAKGSYSIKGVLTTVHYYGMIRNGINPTYGNTPIHIGTPIYRDTCISINFKVTQ
jgi:hypothetical protein